MSLRQIPNDIKSNLKANYQTTKSNMSDMITIYQTNNIGQYTTNWVSISMTFT